MTVTTKSLPTQTIDSAPTYKDNIDATMRVLDEIAGNFAPHQVATPNMTIVIDSGKIWDGAVWASEIQQITTTITAPSVNPRIDRIAIDISTGNYVIITGAENVTPVAPVYQHGQYPICQIALAVSQTQIANADIIDERPLINISPVLLNKLDGTVAPTVNDDSDDGYSEGSFWINVSGNESYRCVDASVGAAVWVNTTLDSSDVAAIYAPLISPALTGNPTAPTQTFGNNSTRIATTAFVLAAKVSDSTKWNGAVKTVSTSAPSGGSDDDIWFEYTP